MTNTEKIFLKRAMVLFRKAFGLNLKIKFKKPEQVRSTFLYHYENKPRTGFEQFECQISNVDKVTQHINYGLCISTIFGCGMSVEESFLNAVEILRAIIHLYDLSLFPPKKKKEVKFPDFESLDEMEIKLLIAGEL